jgi:hypothetical protein
VVNIVVCFLFRNVNFVDAGNYTCFAENKFGDAKAEGTLTVKGMYLKVVLRNIPIEFLHSRITSVTFV